MNLGFTYASLDKYIRYGICEDEELKKKIDDYNYLQMADTVKTDAEKYLGTTIDFKG